jgi:hypothetical protein
MLRFLDFNYRSANAARVLRRRRGRYLLHTLKAWHFATLSSGTREGATMHKAQLVLIGVCGVTSLGLGPLGAQAAPAAFSMTQTMAAVGAQSKPRDVAYRRCWWQGGNRHCRWYGAPYRGYGSYPYPGGGYYYGPTLPEAYPAGSSRWWQEMDREDRGGRGGRG